MRFAAVLLSLCLVACSAGIKIDGVLDETEWSAGRQIAGFKNLKGRQQLKNQPTWFKLLKAEDGVYVAVHCVEPKVAEIPVFEIGFGDEVRSFRDRPVFEGDVDLIKIPRRGFAGLVDRIVNKIFDVVGDKI